MIGSIVTHNDIHAHVDGKLENCNFPLDILGSLNKLVFIVLFDGNCPLIFTIISWVNITAWAPVDIFFILETLIEINLLNVYKQLII